MLLVALASLAFAWLLWPLSGAILWSIVLAIVFAPLQRHFRARFRQWPGFAAFVTMLVIVFIVVIPIGIVGTALLREAKGLYEMLQNGEFDFGLYFQQLAMGLPEWMRNLMARFGVETLATTQQKLTYGFQQGSQFLATQILGISQSAVQLFINAGVMMYQAHVRTGSSPSAFDCGPDGRHLRSLRDVGARHLPMRSFLHKPTLISCD